jgi:hypothetical protein
MNYFTTPPKPLTPCWEWGGGYHSKGYGIFKVAGQTFFAFRLLYEQEVGPIPEGLVPDHLCANTACVRWDHIEPVTHAENIRRGFARKGYPTHCKRGHEYTDANTRWFEQHGRPHRQCRACKQLRAQALNVLGEEAA